VRGNPIVLADPDGRQPQLRSGLTPPGPPPAHPETVRQVLERGTREAVKDVEEVLVNKGVKTVAEPGVELVEVGMSFPLALALVVTLWPANWREEVDQPEQAAAGGRTTEQQ
jgi:hypothetical protein